MKRAVTALVVAASALAGAFVVNAPAGDAQSCTRPNVAATILHAVTPDAPAEAVQQRIFGTVQILVSLDQLSHVTGTVVRSSPSALLNSAALSAARLSTYQTEIRDCVPIASFYVFSVQFADGNGNPIAPVPPTLMPGRATTGVADGRTIVVITAQGVASRAPDVAYLTAGIVTSAESAATAAAKNAAIYDALRAKLNALRIDDGSIRNAYYNVAFASRSAPTAGGYVATRQLSITIRDVADAGAVVDAALAAGVTSVSYVQYGLLDRRAPYQEALAAALHDAASQAQAVATASGMHLAGIKQIETGQNLLGPPTPSPALAPGYSNAIPAAVTKNAHPTPFEVRATIVVTYFLER